MLKHLKLSQILMLMVATVTFVVTTQVTTHASVRADKTEQTARRQLGKKYVWGATGPSAFDCSGFTQYVFKKHRVHLPRTAQQQFNQTKHVRGIHARKGDLVYFGKNRKSIDHVGMYLGNGMMIDSQLRGVVIEAVHSPWWHVVGYSRPARWA